MYALPKIMRRWNVAGKIVKKLEIILTYTLALTFGVPTLCQIPRAYRDVMVASYADGMMEVCVL